MDLLRQRAPSPGALDRNIGFPACAARRQSCLLSSIGGFETRWAHRLESMFHYCDSRLDFVDGKTERARSRSLSQSASGAAGKIKSA